MIGLYFHLPFCVKKCFYCAFDSLGAEDYTNSFAQRYIYALARELLTVSKTEEKRIAADTVFFGGGTPSLIDPAAISYLLKEAAKYYEIMPASEITLEMNPRTVNLSKLSAFKKAGVNRLSVGIQTFSPLHLDFLGRIHSVSDTYEAVKNAKSAGFDSISIDLIFGFPSQTKNDFVNDLKNALELGVSHISLYIFTPEEKTTLGEKVIKGELSMPDEELLADMMLYAHDFFIEAGFCHYEISNFALPGFVCRHNLKYWDYSDYRGFGSSACSFRRRFRYKNIPDPYNYVYAAEHNHLPILEGEKLCLPRAMGEYCMTALRTSEGIVPKRFAELFDLDFKEYYAEKIEELLSRDWLEEYDGNYRVPFKHYIIQSEIASAFIV